MIEEAWQLARTEGGAGDTLEALTDQTLRTAEARARHLGVSRIELRTGWGDVVKSLIDIAAGNSIEMIVLGRRGRGQLAGLLLGSVSQKLVSLAPVPVPSPSFPECRLHALAASFQGLAGRMLPLDANQRPQARHPSSESGTLSRSNDGTDVLIGTGCLLGHTSCRRRPDQNPL